MPRKFQAFFFAWVMMVMTSFALVGILVSMKHYTWAVLMLLLALVMTGVGFMIRKRVLKSIGIERPRS